MRSAALSRKREGRREGAGTHGAFIRKNSAQETLFQVNKKQIYKATGKIC